MKKIEVGVIKIAIVGAWIAFFAACIYASHLSLFFRSSRQITIAAWGGILDPAILEAFEKKTGIAIKVSYYSSNEELLVKMKKTGGKEFDLMLPSDYAVKQLIQEGLLKKLDRSKLRFYKNIQPALLGLSYDPRNEYSVPWEWEVFGIGVDREKITDVSQGWDLIFNVPHGVYSITMVNDPIEMICLAGLYRYGNVGSYTDEQLQEIEKLLLRQKPAVKAYVDFRADYFLATRNCAAVVASTSYILRAQKKFHFIDFVVPSQGTFITIENCVMSTACACEDDVYELLNYLYQPEIVAHHYHEYSLFPATTDSLQLLNLSPFERNIFSLTPEKMQQFSFFGKPASSLALTKVWVSVKSPEL